MNEKTYIRNDEEFIIEECSRKEIEELIGWALEGIRDFDDIDTSVYVLYRDGSDYYESSFHESGREYKGTNIAFAIVSNACTQQVFGEYEVDENGIVQIA